MTQQFIWCRTADVSFLFKALLRRAGEMSDHTKHARQNRQRRKLCVTIKAPKKKKKKKVRIYRIISRRSLRTVISIYFSPFFLCWCLGRGCGRRCGMTNDGLTCPITATATAPCRRNTAPPLGNIGTCI